jgi:hypothetical protein
MKRGVIGNRGQVTIFIIIAILIVALAILAYLLLPGLRTTSEVGAQTPSQYIDTCISEKIETTLETISIQGGSMNPEAYYFYLGDDIEYLCYTNQYYENCVIQKPLLIQNIESEILNEIQNDYNSCFQSLVANYRNDGYEVVLTQGILNAGLLPERVVISSGNKLTITKGESQNFDKFDIVLNSNIYQMASIALNIIEWEQVYGDAPVSDYMNWYPNLKIEKKLQLDGTTIYIITDRDTEEVFQFASRSVVLPPGY